MREENNEADVKISSQKLQYFRVNDIKSSPEQIEFMLSYIRALMRYSKTPELRAYWAIVYSYVKTKLE